MYLFKYVLKRIGLMLMSFIVIFTMCFVLIKLLPNMPAESFGKDMELIMQRRELLGYDKPIMQQYWIYFFGRTAYEYEGVDEETGKPETKVVYEKKKLPEDILESEAYTTRNVGGVIRGYFGTSEVLYLGQDVWDVFAQKVPYTVAINVYTMVFAVPLGLALGMIAATNKNKWPDHLISVGVIVFVSVPSFIYAFLIKYIFYIKLDIFPPFVDAINGAFSWDFLKSAVMPIASMAFGTIAGFARYTRAELTEVLTSEFMLLARTKGLSKGQATLRHALRNAMVPIFPMILGEFVGVMSGSLIIEQMFTVPGVGALYISSVQAQPTPDYNFFLLLTGFYTLIGLSAGIISDISYGIIDPRIRMGAR